MQTYQNMKDSGVAWLGDIPEHWSVINSRRVFSQRKERAVSGQAQLTASQKYGVVTQSEYMKRENTRIVVVEKDHDILKQVEPGDFVISMRSFQGGLEYSKLRGSISSAYVMLKPEKVIDPEYYKYLFKSSSYISALQSTSNLIRDGQAMRYSNFVQVMLPVVPLEEQAAIAAYLDTETTKIDTLITKQEHLLNLLEEKRRATITTAVTPVTHSSEERFRYICELNPPTQSNFEADDIVSFYPMESIGDDGTIDHSQARPYSAVKTGYTVFQNDDVIVAKVTPCFENYKGAHMTGIISSVGFGTTELFVLRANKKVTPEYLYWLTQSQNFNNYLAGGMRGTGGLKRVVPEELKNYKINLPAIEVQRQIVSKLLEDLKKFELLKLDVVKQINLLKERRNSLISHVVTGKVRV